MKNKVNKDILALKVDIKCKKKLAFQDCAYLVDKPDFLLSLRTIRKKYNIDSFMPINKFQDWWLSKIKEDLNEYGTKGKSINGANRLFSNPRNKPTEDEILKSLPYHQQFDFETKLLTRRYRRPGYFHLIIKHAIVCNEVDDSSWEPTYADVRPWELPTDEYLMPEVVIVLSPISTPKDVRKTFEDAQKLFVENEHLKYFSEVRKNPADEIFRDRKWYWKNIAGKSYTDIALSITSKEIREAYLTGSYGRDFIPELGKVQQAMKRYKKLLKL